MKTITKVELGIHENIAKKLIFIDGLARTGKSLFSSIIPSLKNVEHIQFFLMLEHMVSAVHLKSLDINSAKAILRMNLNELAYNIQLSRGVNFRPDDQSGVPNYHDPNVYEKRLRRPDSTEVVEELRAGTRFIPFQTHQLMATLTDFNQLDLDYQMLELFRHPIDTAYSWWNRGWGERWGVDVRAWSLTLQHKDQQVPWYCHGYEDEWLSLNPTERCVRMTLDLQERSVQEYLTASSSDKQRIHIMTFENFVQHPQETLRGICSFLHTEQTNKTWRFIEQAGCPRKMNGDLRARKLSELKAHVKPTLFSNLLDMSQTYETDLFGLARGNP
jgi:hypothetical protein